MHFDQGELNFDGSEQGYQKWQHELDEKKRAFEVRHGIILGKRVRVFLCDIDQPLEGIVWLISKRPPTTSAQLRLAVGSREFTVRDIESIIRLDDEETER